MPDENLVSEESVQRALDWLRDNADDIGKAKEAQVRTEKMLHHHRALAMKLSGETTAAAQEREALASEQYVMAIDRAAESAGEYEKMRALREAAALRIEVWRSSSANYRAMKL